MSENDPVLRIRGLEKEFRAGFLWRRRFKAIDKVDLEVGRGSVFGLLGPNGAGKTTLIKILLGLVRGHGGTAEVFGLPAGSSESRRRVGYLPEAHRLPNYLTGWQVMVLFGMLAGRPRKDVERRAPALLERVGMLKDAQRKVKEYSKGMQQRLGLAQALIHEPEIVFLDEPTDGVDPVGRMTIREMVQDLKEAGVTVFLNSHLLMEVEMICDRVVIMDRGRILREGTIEELTPRTGSVRFEVREIPADLEQVIDGLGDLRHTDARSFELDITGDEQIDAAIDRLRARGVTITSITPRKLSLEQSFIDLVQGERR
ncbi:MAG: ABC transporter ATP-binding protein [Planctomycetota bacterium]|jgi:ABC-2 type transport system ATP-binding protein|nr:ABC transporter ATP-binding protein [Planctomycetota bacterium]MDP6761809.1 ABC transporter ATP-binding protein [Planctomycetota bacterium]MDP6988855.1 ABC transporter ATP-binding protein [Planctomycetota bacterium]